MLKIAIDSLTADEIRVRMAKLVGKILDGFSHFMLAEKYQSIFIDFYKLALVDKS